MAASRVLLNCTIMSVIVLMSREVVCVAGVVGRAGVGVGVRAPDDFRPKVALVRQGPCFGLRLGWCVCSFVCVGLVCAVTWFVKPWLCVMIICSGLRPIERPNQSVFLVAGATVVPSSSAKRSSEELSRSSHSKTTTRASQIDSSASDSEAGSVTRASLAGHGAGSAHARTPSTSALAAANGNLRGYRSGSFITAR